MMYFRFFPLLSDYSLQFCETATPSKGYRLLPPEIGLGMRSMTFQHAKKTNSWSCAYISYGIDFDYLSGVCLLFKKYWLDQKTSHVRPKCYETLGHESSEPTTEENTGDLSHRFFYLPLMSVSQLHKQT